MTSTNTLVRTPAILDQLPIGTEVQDSDGDSGTKTADGFTVPGWKTPLDADWFNYPVTVLNPTPATSNLVADLSSELNLHTVLEELRQLLDKAEAMYQRQDAAIEALASRPGLNTAKIERLEARYDREAARMLDEVLSVIETLTDRRSGP
ncbi:hypothetical protein [Streptomyces cinnamoneus]|uniref:hypothetical protein n=1 Tax=Streptomyces cinnamoneus TaxID=53446 RepID=UPI000CEEB903|nr:hypothetical protein [Streptomyces cinnamoneus]PPT14837.1 hypothetical protein CYQ11_19950 [Streptomyces cinnamoneus]